MTQSMKYFLISALLFLGCAANQAKTKRLREEAAKTSNNDEATWKLRKLSKKEGQGRIDKGKSAKCSKVGKSKKGKTSSDVVLWTNGIGGWRAMSAGMGTAQLLTRIGVISKYTSKLDGISGVSGGSWFVLQFMYSQNFFDAIVEGDEESLEQLIGSWMQNYATIWPTQPDAYVSSFCTQLKTNFGVLAQVDPAFQVIFNLCGVIDNTWNFNFGNMVYDIFRAASTGFGDEQFINRQMNEENKVKAMKYVSAHVETTLASGSRDTDSSSATFIGPKDSVSSVNTVPSPIQFVSGVRHEWFPKNTFSSLQGKVETPAPTNFDFSDFDSFISVPPFGGEESLLGERTTNNTQNFEEPFGGYIPTMAQSIAASSALFASTFPGNPVAYAQSSARILLSFMSSAALRPLIPVLNGYLNAWWNNADSNNVSICTQYRGNNNGECPSPAGRFMDGVETDGLALALTIASHQDRISSCCSDATFKIIVSDNSLNPSSRADFLLFWDTELNEGVAPGEYMWPLQTSRLPIASRQIFEERLANRFELENIEDPVPGTNIKTAILHGTTVDNPVYGVKAGQKVEMFVIYTNSNITSFIDVTLIESLTPQLKKLATDIATNEELGDRILAFLA